MDANYVIHTVGPIYGSCGSECETLLRSCYTNSLNVALELGCNDIAFPAISTGIYGYPKEEAAKVAFNAVREALKTYEIDVRFVFHSANNYEVFLQSIKQ